MLKNYVSAMENWHGRVDSEDDYDAVFASPTRRIQTIFSLDPERVIYLNTFSRFP